MILDFPKNVKKMHEAKIDTNLRPISISKLTKKKLNFNLCVPSHIHAYSICVEYVRNWFLSKFKEDYFKTIYIDGEHILAEYFKYDRETSIKREKPALAILHQEDYSFNNDHIDSTVHTLETSIIRSGMVSPFFKDKKNDLYLKMVMKLMLVNFTFKIKVNTKAKQLDLKNWLSMAFGLGITKGQELDIDYHIPNDIIIQLAKDAGFEIINNKVVDIIQFLTYLNSNSVLPFMYKYRCINGKDEFFIKVPGLYIHHRMPTDISLDDGERQGHISSNYIIEFEVAVRFPEPQFFSLYSQKIRESISYVEDDQLITYASGFNIVPPINEKGWNQFMSTDIIEEDRSKILTIDFKELFDENSDIRKVIDHTMSLYISPAIFMDIKLYNNNKEVPYDIDWCTLVMRPKEILQHVKSHISIYLDTKYFNEHLISLNKLNKTRYEKT